MHPFLDWPGPIAFAHRGGASDNPENTMPAFRHAVELGYTYLETDVHATTDGTVVAFHDADLQRTCGRPGRIDRLPWSDVSTARVAGTEPIPLLDDLLDEFPNARFNIDCKANTAVEPLVALLGRRDVLDRVCVSSFSDSRLRRIRRELGEQLCTSFGPQQIGCLLTSGRAPWGGQAAQVPVALGRLRIVTPRFVGRAHAQGLQVHVWTIDDPGTIGDLLDVGVDGIMSDDIGTLKAVMCERGVWHE